MIPLRDTIPHRRLPIVSVSIIIFNFLIFFIELSKGAFLHNFIYNWALIPQKIIHTQGLLHKILPFISSIFLHGGWLHILGNNWFIWIFADNVEDALGHFKFLIFYLLCGIGGNLFHFMMNFSSPLPAIGASGAISGILGAYFLLFPFSRVLTIVPFFFFWEIVEIPAFIYLGFWFILQFLNGVFSIGVGRFVGGVAWWAHIGGFLTGVFLLKFFIKTRRRRYYL